MGRLKPQPVRGPSRDRTLPGKQRIQMRRYLKWLEKYGEQGITSEPDFQDHFNGPDQSS